MIRELRPHAPEAAHPGRRLVSWSEKLMELYDPRRKGGKAGASSVSRPALPAMELMHGDPAFA
jgi:hypothetical protein